MNIFQKIKLFRDYKKTIKSNKVTLEREYGIRIDRASRLYTVLNIPQELYGEPYNLRKSDIDTISQTYMKEYASRLSSYLNSIGLSELYDYYDNIQKVDKYSYLIVLGFKPLNSVKYYNNVYFKILPVLITSSIITLVYFIFR